MNLLIFKHSIFYFITGKAIVVPGILHGHRDSPGELRRHREKYG